MQKKISENNKLEKNFLIYLKNHWQGFLLSFLSLIFLISKFEISFFLFLYTSGFLFAQFLIGKKWNWLRKLILAPLFSISILIIVCALFDLLGIKISILCMYLIWIGSLIIAGFHTFSIKASEIVDYKEIYIDFLFTLVFLFAIYAHVIPLIYDAAPILHDPVAHAAWAKDIIESGEVNRFYSPGLHFSIAMATLTTNADLARNTLLITQFFTALIAVSSSVFVLEAYKQKWWAFIVGAFFAVSSRPAHLYTGAGKNALAFTLALMFLTWAVFFVDTSKIKKIILCGLLLSATILSHYPLAFICILGLAILFLLVDFKKLFAVCLLIGVIFGIIWGISKLHYQIERSSELTQNQIDQKITFDDLLTKKGVKAEIVSYFNEIKNDFSFRNINYEVIISRIGYLLMILLGFKDRKYWFFPIFYFITDVLIRLGVMFRPINPLWIITSTQIITRYLYSRFAITLAISILLFDTPKKIFQSQKEIYNFVNPVVVILFFLMVLNGATEINNNIAKFQTDFRVVIEEDLEAFKWMTENLDPKNKILVDARIHENEYKVVVFAGDSGVWIPIYTDFQTNAPFEDGFNIYTYEKTQLYLKLAEDPQNCSIREELIRNGFKYYFRGSKSAHAEPLNVLDSGFELIYSNDPVKIYKILPCEN